MTTTSESQLVAEKHANVTLLMYSCPARVNNYFTPNLVNGLHVTVIKPLQSNTENVMQLLLLGYAQIKYNYSTQ